MDICSKIELRALASLVPYANNARVHDGIQVKSLVESIKNFGFTVPIVIDEKNEIMAGHGRLMAAKVLGLTQVPCVLASNLTAAQKRAFILADNQIALQSSWDMGVLAQEIALAQQDGISADIMGFSAEDLRKIRSIASERSGESKDPDDVPTIDPANVWVKRGDIYQLGRHVLMCGDCTDPMEVNMAMNDLKADLVLTDPPYNVNYEGSDGQKIQNDNMSEPEFATFCYGFYSNYFEVMKPGAAIYVFHSDSQGHVFRQSFLDAGFTFDRCLIWNKNSLVMGRFDYHMKHEPILYGFKPGGDRQWFGSSEEGTVINHDKPRKNDRHPTMKPVSLLEKLMLNSSRPNDVVIDFFGGSGSTLIAAEQQNRRCVMIELDEVYAQTIIERWQEFANDKAHKIVER